MPYAMDRLRASRAETNPHFPHLEIGIQLFHNGVPVQLLYQIGRDKSHETWRVRPLFIEGPDRDERFSRSDCLSFLHTMRAPSWRRAA
jgi:hypothetical protein